MECIDSYMAPTSSCKGWVILRCPLLQKLTSTRIVILIGFGEFLFSFFGKIGKLTWNLEIAQLKRKVIFEGFFGVHVNFPECIFSWVNRYNHN